MGSGLHPPKRAVLTFAGCSRETIIRYVPWAEQVEPEHSQVLGGAIQPLGGVIDFVPQEVMGSPTLTLLFFHLVMHRMVSTLRFHRQEHYQPQDLGLSQQYSSNIINNSV